ncbi:MAG: hypothetical protein SGJ18_11155 [Pseudomonadota bacterium]|nr:hypothetical protein [Pseudomonadota bacterium]
MQNVNKLLILALTSTLACSENTGDTQFERKDNFEKVSIGQGNHETMIPSELWDRLEKFYTDSGLTLEDKIAERGSKQKKIEVPVLFMPLKVFLSEKTSGTLGGQNYQIGFEQGGGTLDLKNFVKKNYRSFYLAVELGENTESGSLKIFFVSNAKEAPIGKEIYGSGCGKYMDITSFYNKVISKVGVELSAAGNRYVHVVTGTYIFALIKNSSLYLSQVTVLDSRFKKSMCRF